MWEPPLCGDRRGTEAPPTLKPAMRTIIAGVGYINLSDSSVGPISVVHNFVEASPRYERMILITAADFGAKPPALRWHRWPAILPEPGEVQARVVEAATGVIDWKNLLVILQQFEVLPKEVYVLAVQPVKTDFGMN